MHWTLASSVLKKPGSVILPYKCTGYVVSAVSVPSAEHATLSEMVVYDFKGQSGVSRQTE
jgi:hypothetical protein